MKKFSFILLILIFALSGISIKHASASSLPPWYESTTSSDNSQVKVTLSGDPTKITGKPETITFDSSDYNNGNNVMIYISYNNSGVARILNVTYGSKCTITATENKEYDVVVVKAQDYDPSRFVPNVIDPSYEVYSSASINNIDTTPTTFINKGEKLEYGYPYINLEIHDDMGVAWVKSPDGTYSNNYENMSWKGEGDDAASAQITHNGTYNFEAKDYAGHLTTYSVKITDYKVVPLSVNTYKLGDKYITGKTLPYAEVGVCDENYNYGETKANSKGDYKIKLTRHLSINSHVSIESMDTRTHEAMHWENLKIKK